jgi:hypothetical protein
MYCERWQLSHKDFLTNRICQHTANAMLEATNEQFEEPVLYISYVVVRVPGYRSRGPGSIPGATRVSEN